MTLRKQTFAWVILALIVGLMPMVGAQDDNVDVYGLPLPDDAAPYDDQVMRVMCDATAPNRTLSAVVFVYQRLCFADQFSDALVYLNNDLQLIPGAAESWEPSEDGLTWTFHLRPDQVWSDGTPFTARDFEASYRYTATPDSGYDFTWMWAGIIKNYAEVVAGELPPEELGVVAVDDLTLEVTTEFPFPPLPNTLFFWPPLQADALAEHGPDYIIDPETHVSAGPFILTEFTPGESAVFEANPTYTGFRPPVLNRVEVFYGDTSTQFLAFQDSDLEYVQAGASLGPAEFEIINADPVLSENYFPNPGDFRTDYLGFDAYNPPFDNVLVRQAFAKSLDRESIVSNIIGEQQSVPAYSMLAPGFPASDVEGNLRQYQEYDCEAAQALLAEAGYPDGEGFPDVTLQLRNEGNVIRPRYDAAAASISECLNINIEVENLDFTTFMTGLNNKPTDLQFYAVDYGMDYLDPANMMGTLWTSDGRHSWRNTEFDSIAQEANSLVGDPERRTQLYQEAERILVEDVGAAFLDHRISGHVFQPYLQGAFRDLNSQGLPGWQWGNDWMWSTFYISADVAEYDTYRNN